MSDPTPFSQAKYQVRFDWGAAGIERITADAHVVVLVDALSFTTTVVVAAEYGVAVAPCGRQIEWAGIESAGTGSAGIESAGTESMGTESAGTESDAARLAERLGGVVAGRRGEPGPTLSPASFVSEVPQSPLVVLHSPNGGALASLLEGRETDEPTDTAERPDAAGPVVLAASMRNRTAVAERILALQERRGERMIVAVIAAGRSAGASDGSVRFAIEDQLVGGAVIDASSPSGSTTLRRRPRSPARPSRDSPMRRPT